MRWRRGVLLAVVALSLIPGYGLCNEIVQFSLTNFSLLNPVAQISSVTGSGGTGHSGMLSVSSGSLDLSASNWFSGGGLGITASGMAGSVASNQLMGASFHGASLSGSNLILTGFSGSLNSNLANYYGVGSSLNGASVNIWSGVLSVDPGGGSVAAPEAGGVTVTLGLMLVGGLVLLVGVRSRIIKVVI